MILFKVCPNCNTEHNIANFHKNKNKSDGLAVYCKDCMKVFSKYYYKHIPKEMKTKVCAYANCDVSFTTNTNKIYCCDNHRKYAHKDTYLHNLKRRIKRKATRKVLDNEKSI